MLMCTPVHSCRPVPLGSAVLTQTESRPCLQVASDLSRDVRHIQPLLEVSLSPSRQSGCLSVVFTLGTGDALPKDDASGGERHVSSSLCSQEHVGSGACAPSAGRGVAQSSRFVCVLWADGCMDGYKTVT